MINLYLPICDSVTIWNNMHGEAKLIAKKTLSTDGLEIEDIVTLNKLLQIL